MSQASFHSSERWAVLRWQRNRKVTIVSSALWHPCGVSSPESRCHAWTMASHLEVWKRCKRTISLVLSGLPSAFTRILWAPGRPLRSRDAPREWQCHRSSSAVCPRLLLLLPFPHPSPPPLLCLLLLPPASFLPFSVTSHSASCFLCTQPVLSYVLFRSLGESIFSNTCCPNKIVTGLSMGDVWHFTDFSMAGECMLCYAMEHCLLCLVLFLFKHVLNS